MPLRLFVLLLHADVGVRLLCGLADGATVAGHAVASFCLVDTAATKDAAADWGAPTRFFAAPEMTHLRLVPA